MTSINHILHYVGNRSPALLDTITSDGVAVDLTGSTVKLQMRAVGSSTLKVDTAATVVSAPAGTVSYSWAAVDVDTAGYYVAWWRVTLSGGNLQDTPEFLVEMRAHSAVTNQYISMGELKSSLAITEQFADADIMLAIGAASRAVDFACSRVFYAGTPGEVRKYTPISGGYVSIDDATAITAVSDQAQVLTVNNSYYLEPANAAALNRPYTGLRAGFAWAFMLGFPDSISVTGTFGWASVPPQVSSATSILASKLLRRVREAAFGVIGIGFDGAAVNIIQNDPELNMLLQPLKRSNTL